MRPERQFAKVAAVRTKAIEGLDEAKLKGELRNVNALYSLLDDRYSKKVCYFILRIRQRLACMSGIRILISSTKEMQILVLNLRAVLGGAMMIWMNSDHNTLQYPTPKHVLAPQSNPGHYTDLMEEMERAPQRGWWDNFVAGIKGRIRFS